MPNTLAAEQDKETFYGLLQLAEIEVAFPISSLREVVQCPTEFSAIPVQADGLLGVMDLRGLVIPVVDLGHHLGQSTEQRNDKVVVVITDGTHLLGVLADQLQSVVKVSCDDLVPVRSDGTELFVSHTFHQDQSRSIVSVLNVPVIFGLPGLPMVEDVSEDVSTVGDASSTGDEDFEKYTLLKCGNYVLALDIKHVHTMLPAPTIKPSVLDSDLCFGVTSYYGNDVPVIDPLTLLQLERDGTDDRNAGLVLKFESGFVVIAINELLELTDIPTKNIMTLPSYVVRRPEHFTGIAEVDDLGQCLILNQQSLFADADLLSYAGMNTLTNTTTNTDTPTSLVEKTQTARHNAGPPQMLYSLGIDIATPLEQISEVLSFPEISTTTNVGGGVIAVITHRNKIVPVVSLANLLGLETSSSSQPSCLLLVDLAERQIAFAVDALRAITPLAWKDAEERAPINGGYTLDTCPLVQLGEETQLIPQLDLATLAQAFDAK